MYSIKPLLWAMLVVAASAGVHAQTTWSPNLNRHLSAPYLPEVLKATPALKSHIVSLLKQNNQLSPWIAEGLASGAMVTTPVTAFAAGKTVFVSTFCKPHDCGDTEWTLAYEPKTQALVLQQNNTVLFNRAAQDMYPQMLQVIEMRSQLNHMFW